MLCQHYSQSGLSDSLTMLIMLYIISTYRYANTSHSKLVLYNIMAWVCIVYIMAYVCIVYIMA